jgi:hypothetical protein
MRSLDVCLEFAGASAVLMLGLTAKYFNVLGSKRGHFALLHHRTEGNTEAHPSTNKP